MPIDSLVQGRMSEQVQNAITGNFAIETIQFNVPFARSEHAIRLKGRFLVPTESAYDSIAQRGKTAGYVVYFRREEDADVIYFTPGRLPEHRPRWTLAVALFAVTIVSVFLTGGLVQETAASPMTLDWVAGLSYAIPLMLILLAHELGHFFVGRHHRMSVSPPYFIPLPLSVLGTMGAVIVMVTPPKNRKQLLQLGAAGPLAGLLFAIPLLIIGLSYSHVEPLPIDDSFYIEGNSLLYLGLKWLMFGQILPTADGQDVFLHNIAFAAWAGLLVTALNLIPAGQLDGGHAAYTLFGIRIRPLTFVIIGVLVGLAVYTQFWGWLLWAALLFFFGQTYAVPLDDITPLDTKHKALAVFMLVLFVLLFMPNPLRVITP